MKKIGELKNIKLIVADLDGTLLSSEGNLGKETKKLIKELKEKDVLFTFASGRLHSALVDFASQLDIKVPMISLEGSLIKNYPDGNVIFESFVPEKYVRIALNYADKFLLNVALCHADAVYYTETNSIIPQIMDMFGASFKEVSSYDEYHPETLELVFASDFKENIKSVKDKLSFPNAFGLNVSYFRSLTHSGIYYLEVRKKGTNKGKAFLKLLKELKIKPANSAVIGDWYNDNSLFETSAYKVTLANGVPELKRKADFITKKDNNEDGVAEFFEEVLKAKTG